MNDKADQIITGSQQPQHSLETNEPAYIDAEGQILGRLATKIAIILRGKDRADFVLNKKLGRRVVVKNAAKIRVTGKKLTDKVYYRHSGYPGGIYKKTLGEAMISSPEWVIKHAVRGMLPDNRLRNSWLKNLTFEDNGK